MDKDFKDMGGKMPFEVPEGFFTEMEKNLVGKAPVSRHRFRPWMGWTVAAALLVGVLSVWMSGRTSQVAPDDVDFLYTYQIDMSDSELEVMADLVESDIFLSLDSE